MNPWFCGLDLIAGKEAERPGGVASETLHCACIRVKRRVLHISLRGVSRSNRHAFDGGIKTKAVFRVRIAVVLAYVRDGFCSRSKSPFTWSSSRC